MKNSRNNRQASRRPCLQTSSTDSGLSPYFNISRILIALIGLSCGIDLNASLERTIPLQAHVEKRLLVRPAPTAGPNEIGALFDNLEARVVRHFPMMDDLQLWEIGADYDVPSALTRCLDSGLFQLAEPDYLIYSTNLPNDSSFTDRSLWHLDNTS